MFQYSFVLKSITWIIYSIVKETSSEKIEKLYELSLILRSHACANITENIIGHFSVTNDCVRLLIRGFPLYTYSMVILFFENSILKSHACANVTHNIIEQFPVTIDCVRFRIRGFPLYTYSMDNTKCSIMNERFCDFVPYSIEQK